MSIESNGTRDRFFDGRNAVRRAVLPQLLGRTLSINDPDGRAVARWDVADMTVVDQNKANGSMVFTIASDPKMVPSTRTRILRRWPAGSQSPLPRFQVSSVVPSSVQPAANVGS